MTQLDLLNFANIAYDDGIVSLKPHYNQRTGALLKNKPGDMLARFIVVELIETFDKDASEEQQVAEAHRVMFSATRQLFNVAMRFSTFNQRRKSE